MFGTGGWTKNLKSTQGLSFISNLFLSALLNNDLSIIKGESGLDTKPISEMNDAEIITYLKEPFTDLLNKTKQALQLGVYPSMMIDLLRIKDKIPEVLINSKRRLYNRTIKGLQMAGYLDEDENFTNKVKSYQPKKWL